MKISAGAPLSICLASVELAASDTMTCLPLSFWYWSPIASSAFLRLAAAKTRTSPPCAAACPTASRKSSATATPAAHHRRSNRFAIPLSATPTETGCCIASDITPAQLAGGNRGRVVPGAQPSFGRRDTTKLANRLVGGQQLIADPGNRHDVLRVVRVDLDPLAQLAHIHAQIFDVAGVVPDFAQDLLVGEHLAGMQYEQPQDRELGRRYLDV